MITNKITAELFLNDGTKIILDKTKMKSVQSISQSNSDSSTIYYGCLPSTGSLEIIDSNGDIKSYIENGLIDISSLEINLYINNKIIRHHISTNSEYIEEDNSFKISLGDILDLWDEINFTGYYYPGYSETAYDMFCNIFIKYGYSQLDIDNMLLDIVINEKSEEITIKDYLKYINIEYPYLPSSSFREMVDKFCTLAQLNCFLNIDGTLKFINARPIASVYTNPIIIPKKSMYNSFSKSVLLKNKYDYVELNKYIVSINKEIKTNVYSQNITEFYETDENGNFEYHKANDDFAGTVYYQFGAYAYVYAKYNKCSNITIPKLSNFNLKKITNVYTGLDGENNTNIKYSLKYNKYTSSSAMISISMKSEGDFAINKESDNITNESSGEGYIQDFSTTITYDWQTTSLSGTLSATANIEDKSNLSNIKYLNDENGNFIFNNIICVSGITKKTLKGYNRKTNNFPEFPDGINLYGDVEIIDAFNVNIEFYGDVEEILFEEENSILENVNNIKNPVNIQTNELISNKTTVDNTEISEVLKNNILLDYSNGISNGTLNIAYVDYYYENGDLAINTSNGDIITVGSFVKIEGDERMWRVTGVNFEKNGYPQYSELQVMEVKTVDTKIKLELNLYKSSIIITRVYSDNPDATIGEISEQDEIFGNDILKFKIVPYESIVDASIQSITINGDNYTNNSEYIVKGNIKLDAVVYSWDEVVVISDGSFMRLDLQSATGNEQWENVSTFIPKIVANRDIRISGKPDISTKDGYNIDIIPEFVNIGNLDWGDAHSDIVVTSSEGLVLGNISFSVKKPINDGEFRYDNYSSVGDNAYISALMLSKIEQYK